MTSSCTVDKIIILFCMIIWCTISQEYRKGYLIHSNYYKTACVKWSSWKNYIRWLEASLIIPIEPFISLCRSEPNCIDDGLDIDSCWFVSPIWGPGLGQSTSQPLYCHLLIHWIHQTACNPWLPGILASLQQYLLHLILWYNIMCRGKKISINNIMDIAILYIYMWF